MIHCNAVTFDPEPGSEELFWLIGESFVPDNDSHPVYFNSST